MSASTLPATAPTRPIGPPERPKARWPPAVCALILATLVARAAGFAYPFLSYHLKHIGFTTSSVGQVLAVFGTGWLVGQLVTGWAADRYGRRRTLVVAMATATVCLPVLAQARSFSGVCAGALLAGIVYDAPRPVVTSVIADLVPDDSERAKINGWRYGSTNIGAAITGAAGGALAGAAGFTMLFWLNAAACAAYAVIALRFLEADPKRPDHVRAHRARYRPLLGDSRLWLLWAASVAALTCAAAIFTSLPMMMEDDGLPPSAYGWTQVANAAAVVALTPVITPWLSRRCGRLRPLIGMLAFSALLLGVGMGGAGLADTTGQYSIAVAIAVPGEIVFFIAATDVLNKISPDHARGLYAGIWGSTLAVAVIAAPSMAAWSLTSGGGPLTALTTLSAGCLGAALCLPLAPLTRRLQARAVTPGPAAHLPLEPETRS
ncbi:MFS transporter [Streptomyces sp. NPDC002402]